MLLTPRRYLRLMLAAMMLMPALDAIRLLLPPLQMPAALLCCPLRCRYALLPRAADVACFRWHNFRAKHYYCYYAR